MIFKKVALIGLAMLIAGVIAFQFLGTEDLALPNIEATPINKLKKLPDFSKYVDVKEKKEAFFTTLYPIIEEENKHILKIQSAIVLLQNQTKDKGMDSLLPKQSKWLKGIATHYRVKNDILSEQTYLELLGKVDIIPPSLALTQAAIESGWGSSRFSKEGNNLFGQWCFSKGCGMVPSSRDDDKDHEVSKFPTVNAAVRAYLRNLNTNSAYQKLRDKRARIRQSNGDLTGIELAQTLTEYSEERELYITKVSSFINQNKLQRFTKQFEGSLLINTNI